MTSPHQPSTAARELMESRIRVLLEHGSGVDLFGWDILETF
jgi:hypothetical protein